MSEQESLTRKRKIRGGHRASCTRVVREIRALLTSTDPNGTKMKQQKRFLEEKLTLLRGLDGEILELLRTEEELEAEIEQTDVCNEEISLAIAEVEEVLLKVNLQEDSTVDCEEQVRESRPTSRAARTSVGGGETSLQRHSLSLEDVNSSMESRNPRVSRVKLPKLSFKKFGGDITSWSTFWDSFHSAVHSNEDLSNVDKFNYLISFLEGSAAECISGLTLTSANYEEAVAVLKRRFGNKQQIVNRHMEALLELEAVTSIHDIQPLRTLCDKIESHVRSLNSLGVPSSSYGSLLSSIVMNKMPQEIRLVVSRKLVDCEWGFDEFIKIVEEEVDARERASLVASSTMAAPRKSKDRPTATSLLSSESTCCTYCGRAHPSSCCRTISSVTDRKEFLVKSGRCFQCLKKGHLSKDCRSKANCQNCRGRHHTSICYKTSGTSRECNSSTPAAGPPTSSAAPASDSARNPTQRPSSSALLMHLDPKTPVLLQTARAIVRAPHRQHPSCCARIILDTGSQRSYVTNRLKESLSLESEQVEEMLIKTFGTEKHTKHSCPVVTLSMDTKDGRQLQLQFLTVPLICEPLSGQPVVCAAERYPHLSKLELADAVEDGDNLDVDVLIGSDHYWKVVSGRVIQAAHGPTALKTKFGWVLSGPAHGLSNGSHGANLLITHTLRIDAALEQQGDSDLDASLKRLWDLEILGIKEDESSIYEKFTTSVQHHEGRYEVELPWKETHPTLPDNLDLSQARLRNLLLRLRKDQCILREYDSVIKNQLSCGIIEVVEKPLDGVIGRTHYLPHHAVIRKDKLTTKLRIVYDASARGTGASLNDCLYSGPNFGQNIMAILLRFRTHKIGIVGDIEKAFLMISIAPKDRDVLRFLWIDSIDKVLPRIMTFRFKRVVFGVSASPFLLNATIQHHMKSYEAEDAAFVRRFLRSIYVDDVVSGAKDLKEASAFYHKCKSRLLAGGFNLRKIISNSAQLQHRASHKELEVHQAVKVEGVQEEDQSYAKNTLGDKQATSSHEHKVLGVNWSFKNDEFVFDLRFISTMAAELELTKAVVVSLTSRIYDPLGIVSPVTVQLKMMCQELCEAKVDWNETLCEEMMTKWKALMTNIAQMSPVTVPRFYLAGLDNLCGTCTLQGFCDASLKAYAAVVYLRIQTVAGCVVRLVASKSRVAPVRTQTIPRLELLSALLLAKLLSNVMAALAAELKLDVPVCYTDSRVALYWIQGQHKEWKQYVQNRVDAIRKLVPVECWRHCSGHSNPADLPSRGSSLGDVQTRSLWLQGPDWLKGDLEPDKCISGTMPEECQQELKMKITQNLLVVEASNLSEILDCEEYSSFRRLLRVTANVLLFIERLKRKVKGERNDEGSQLESLLVQAELYWLRVSQVSLPQHKQFVQWKQQFGLFSDPDGLWRCGGRLENADISDTAKSPILLNVAHYITRLIVTHAHESLMHSGVKDTLTQLRSRFWIVKGRQFVRKTLHKCMICRRFIGKSYCCPAPPPLPECRVKEAFAFSSIGVDFAGPLYVKNPEKAWICLYTCCATRAVHLDILTDLSTDSFIRSFRRFVARRGFPNRVISDNGKTFKGADKAIQAMLRHSMVKKFLSDLNIKWQFNVERAPWWGGLFERLIRSMKQCLRRVIGRARLSLDELSTAVVEVEGILNSRPLTYVSTEELEEPLTPSHLLVGHRIFNMPQPNYSGDEDYENDVPATGLTQRFKYLNTVLTHFWNRWRKEYLSELREGHRYSKKNGGNKIKIAVGDVVLVHDQDLPRTLWRLAVVERLIEGTDGEIRAAEIRVKSGKQASSLFRRSVQHLYPLELNQAQDVLPPSIAVTVEQEATLPPPPEPRPSRTAAQRAGQRIRAMCSELNSD